MSVPNRRFSLIFIVLALGCVVLSHAAWDSLKWFAALLAYAGFTFLLLAICYATNDTRLLLKQHNGRQAVFAWVLFGPYFVLSECLFQLDRLTRRQPAVTRVITNLYLGRRLMSGECHAHQFRAVIDLAAEFAEARLLRELERYRSMPVLDGTSPTPQQLQDTIVWIHESIQVGPVYVHCALGHGRSACVVVAYLLAIGTVKTIDEGEAYLRTLRPGVRLNASQKQTLQKWQIANTIR